jgi:sugar phosphate isomerase/epimerase
MLADKITHIHASDNDGVEDQHLGIGQGKIDWNWFAQTIKKLGYDKTVILESTTNITESLQKLKQLLG